MMKRRNETSDSTGGAEDIASASGEDTFFQRARRPTAAVEHRSTSQRRGFVRSAGECIRVTSLR